MPRPETLILSHGQIASILTMEMAIEAVRRVMAAHGEGRVIALAFFTPMRRAASSTSRRAVCSLGKRRASLASRPTVASSPIALWAYPILWGSSC